MALKKVFILLVALTFIAPVALGQKTPEAKTSTSAEHDSLSALVTGFTWMFQGAYLQFTQVNNLYYLPPAVATTWYAFDQDKRVSAYARSRELKKHVDIIGDMGVALNFPFMPIGFYYYGRYKNSDHAIQFGMEYFAALYLALSESGILSFIDVHERPEKHELSFWETQFRGRSSWPSGHIIPYTTLFFKTMQFYGPYWSILPLIGSVWSSQQRVQDGKHWLSDVVASFWLSAFASEGVRAAGKYKKNHPFYKWIFEREARVGIIHHKNKIGPRLVWNF